MNTKIIIFIGIIALLYFLYCYQNRIERNIKKKHKGKHKQQKTTTQIKQSGKSVNEEDPDKQKKQVKISNLITEYQPDSADSELDYLSLSGMTEESGKYDSLSILDNISDDNKSLTELLQ